MANTKVSDLTGIASVATNDVVYLVDVSDLTDSPAGSSRKGTVSQLPFATSGANSNITSLTGLTTPLTVPQGGTGAASLTGVLLGNGTSAVSALASTGSGNVVRATSPTINTSLAVSGTEAITGSSGTMTLSASTDGGEYNIGVDTTGTLAIFGSGAQTLNVSLLDGTLKIASPGNASTNALTTDATQTLTNKRVTKRTVTTTQSATPTINTDNTDVAYITGLQQAITSMTTNLSGTPVANDGLIVSITDNGTARAITWGASFESSGNVTLPTTTAISVRLDVAFLWNVATTKWRCVGVA